MQGRQTMRPGEVLGVDEYEVPDTKQHMKTKVKRLGKKIGTISR